MRYRQFYPCLKKGKYDEVFKTSWIWKRCEDCKLELDSYVMRNGGKWIYSHNTKLCHICRENRKKAREVKA